MAETDERLIAKPGVQEPSTTPRSSAKAPIDDGDLMLQSAIAGRRKL